MTALEIIRAVGREFANVPDDQIEMYIDIVRPMVSKKRFGDLYEHGLAYLVMHKMKMAGYGDNPLGTMGTIGIGFSLSSVSEGGSSISFGANQSSNLAKDSELTLTSYGLQFLSIRRMVIVPIHCSGEGESSVGGIGVSLPYGG